MVHATAEDDDADSLEARAAEAAAMLRLLANEKRLLILCHLGASEEMSVGALSEAVGLRQSALSQHLARMRAEGLVATRRQSQTVFYRVADPKVMEIIDTMTRIFCADLKHPGR